jgi:hypothetical protein
MKSLLGFSIFLFFMIRRRFSLFLKSVSLTRVIFHFNFKSVFDIVLTFKVVI